HPFPFSVDFHDNADSAARPAMACALLQNPGSAGRAVDAAAPRAMGSSRASGRAWELEGMFERAPGYMAMLQGEQHIVDLASPACRRLFGGRAWTGAPLRDVLPAGCGGAILDILDQAYGSGTPRVERELRLTFQARREATTEVRYLDFACLPTFHADGSVRGLFVQGHDVTRQTMGNRSLHDAVQLREGFLATLAHELRNPLAPIINVGNILRHLPDEGDKLSRLGDILHRQAVHMQRLIDDLLDTARDRKGLLKLSLAPVDVREVIDTAVEQVALLMKQRRHELTLQVQGPVRVLGDSARLVQVVANLLHNAARYTPPGGKVALRAAAHGLRLEIVVSDNGIGLDPAFLPRVFDPFSQAERPSGAEHGLGLGLALVRSLAELHGGSADASSQGLGHGSTFTLWL